MQLAFSAVYSRVEEAQSGQVAEPLSAAQTPHWISNEENSTDCFLSAHIHTKVHRLTSELQLSCGCIRVMYYTYLRTSASKVRQINASLAAIESRRKFADLALRLHLSYKRRLKGIFIKWKFTTWLYARKFYGSSVSENCTRV